MTDRNLLLQQIQNGVRLRPTKTVDKSVPFIHTEGDIQFGSTDTSPSSPASVNGSNHTPSPKKQQNTPPPPLPPPPPMTMQQKIAPISLSVIQHSPSSQSRSTKSPSPTAAKPPNPNLMKKFPTQTEVAMNRDALMQEIRNGSYRLKKSSSTNSASKVRFQAVNHVKQFNPIDEDKAEREAFAIIPQKLEEATFSAPSKQFTNQNGYHDPMVSRNNNDHHRHYQGRPPFPDDVIRRKNETRMVHQQLKPSNETQQSFKELSFNVSNPKLFKSQSSTAVMNQSLSHYQTTPMGQFYRKEETITANEHTENLEKINDNSNAQISPPLVKGNVFYRKPQNNSFIHQPPAEIQRNESRTSKIDTVTQESGAKRRSQSFDDTLDNNNETIYKPTLNNQQDERVVSEYIWRRPSVTKEEIRRMMSAATWHKVPRTTRSSCSELKSWDSVQSIAVESRSDRNFNDNEVFSTKRSNQSFVDVSVLGHDAVHPSSKNYYYTADDSVRSDNGETNFKTCYKLSDGTMKRVNDLRKLYESRTEIEYGDPQIKTKTIPANLSYMTTLPRVSQLRHCFEIKSEPRIISITKSPTDSRVHENLRRRNNNTTSNNYHHGEVGDNKSNGFDNVSTTSNFAKNVHPDVVVGRATVKTLPFQYIQPSNVYPKQKVLVINNNNHSSHYRPAPERSPPKHHFGTDDYYYDERSSTNNTVSPSQSVENNHAELELARLLGITPEDLQHIRRVISGNDPHKSLFQLQQYLHKRD